MLVTTPLRGVSGLGPKLQEIEVLTRGFVLWSEVIRVANKRADWIQDQISSGLREASGKLGNHFSNTLFNSTQFVN
jgi:hypothetical protein